MSTRKSLSLAALLCVGFAGALAAADDGKNGLGARPGLGAPIAESDIKAWDITILPDGTNLPPGSGTAAVGAKLFVEKGCNQCHGEGGRGGKNAALVSDEKLEGQGIEANKTIKDFWAYSTTLYDYVRRAMPWPSPRTLSNEEVYNLVAYILSENKLIPPDAVMDAKSLPAVKMPNRDHFIVRFPERI
jgi:cytochrome c